MALMPDHRQLAKLLDVDEVQTTQLLDGIKVGVRIDNKWMAATIDVRDMKKPLDQIGRVLFDLVKALKRRIALDDARRDLYGVDKMLVNGLLTADEARAIADLPPLPGEQDKRPANRFEAIAEELKKMGEAK